MLKRDFYEILGVSPQATPVEIKRAYRRIALAAHPDAGLEFDSEHFREAHEAYQILNDPESRRSYDTRLGNRRRSVAEPLRVRQPVSIVDDFLRLRPSIGEVLDHLRQNFFGYRPKSGGPYQRLRVEAILEQDEARFGCRLPFNVPCYVKCGQCAGVGGPWEICPFCCGRGMVQSARQIVLEIPPNAQHGERYEIDLSDVGITNLLLEVSVLIP